MSPNLPTSLDTVKLVEVLDVIRQPAKVDELSYGYLYALYVIKDLLTLTAVWEMTLLSEDPKYL